MLLCAFPAEGNAESRAYCSSLPELGAKVKDCAQNVFFAKAAQVCLAKLEKEIAAQQAFLDAAMMLNDAATASAQAARIQNNSANLTGLRSTMETLEGDARTARAEVLKYTQNFVYAGPISQAMAAKLHLENFLGKFKCVTDNRAAVAQVVKHFDGHIAEFEKVSRAARSMETIDAANVKKLDASSLNSVAHGRAPASPPPAAARTAKAPANPASTITGTEKIGESDRALQRAAPTK